MKIKKYAPIAWLVLSTNCQAQSEFHGKMVSLGLGQIILCSIILGSIILSAVLNITMFRSLSAKGRLIAFIVVSFIPIVYLYVLATLSNIKDNREAEKIAQIRQKLNIAARTRFEELCKTEEGEKLYVKLKGVRAFMIKQNPATMTWGGQMAHQLIDKYAIDPYLNASSKGSYSDILAPYLVPGAIPQEQKLYKKVTPEIDTIEEYLLDKKVWQITGVNIKTPPNIPTYTLKKSIKKPDYIPKSKYALEVESAETKTDRELYFIAGVRFKITEIATNKLIATKTVFLRDPGLGINTEARIMWKNAKEQNQICPAFTWEGPTPNPGHVPDLEVNNQPHYELAKWIVDVLNP